MPILICSSCMIYFIKISAVQISIVSYRCGLFIKQQLRHSCAIIPFWMRLLNLRNHDRLIIFPRLIKTHLVQRYPWAIYRYSSISSFGIYILTFPREYPSIIIRYVNRFLPSIRIMTKIYFPFSGTSPPKEIHALNLFIPTKIHVKASSLSRLPNCARGLQ
ncbi:hypothetical protein D3C81_1354470 [compost metagenome]